MVYENCTYQFHCIFQRESRARLKQEKPEDIQSKERTSNKFRQRKYRRQKRLTRLNAKRADEGKVELTYEELEMIEGGEDEERVLACREVKGPERLSRRVRVSKFGSSYFFVKLVGPLNFFWILPK